MIRCEEKWIVKYDDNKVYCSTKEIATEIHNKCLLAGYKQVFIKKILVKTNKT